MANPGMVGFSVLNLGNYWRPQVLSKRFRYWATRKPYIWRYGYKDEAFPTGLLPRKKDAPRITGLPIYRPKDQWSKEKALFGQNDYIDIFGDGNLHPIDIMYNVPKWLRGFRGNELQRLIRKEKYFENTKYPEENPLRWKKMKARIDWLWYELNYRRRIH